MGSEQELPPLDLPFGTLEQLSRAAKRDQGTRLTYGQVQAIYAALTELSALRSRLAGVEGQGWVSVQTRLPGWKPSARDRREGVHGDEFLVLPRTDGSTAWYGTRASDEPNFYRHGRVVNVTHWMPLPAPIAEPMQVKEGGDANHTAG